MANYEILRYGTTGEDVKKLQEALNKAGYTLTNDGIYGEKTRSAVTDYQKANGLLVDGIAGSETLGHLYREDAPVQTETKKEPTPWEKWVGRQAFSYDPAKDPVYDIYKQQYLNLGKLAMEDTVGRAAALTGGYGNSYAQTAGQQAYQGYVQQLAEVIPSLYESAYNRYTAEGQEMYDQAVAWDKQRQAAREELEALIEKGYSPTDEELSAVGLTRSQAAVLQSAKTKSTTSSKSSKTYSTRGYTKEEVMQLQSAAGITVDGIWGRQTEDAYQAGYRKDGSLRTREFIKNVIPESQHDTIQRKLWGSYRDYLRGSIRADETLTEQDKKYLLNHYSLT